MDRPGKNSQTKYLIKYGSRNFLPNSSLSRKRNTHTPPTTKPALDCETARVHRRVSEAVAKGGSGDKKKNDNISVQLKSLSNLFVFRIVD